ncbi:MSMEG_0567/sll0787 family protein [Pseudokineococcus sp. 1T1Z-3]|uniref:MSMEG_0567/sll0787 family protein n=1 Tax=Pseudokineococcus sp. 1T1Z-3 TaxID=3132745 RepID=UPI00403F4047
MDLAPPTWHVEVADGDGLAAYRRLRRHVFVSEQELFPSGAAEADDVDDDPRAVVLVARLAGSGEVVGGVRLAPAGQHLTGGLDVGWWTGSRLAVAAGARRAGGIGPALVRAACAVAEQAGVLRFEATVQRSAAPMFVRLGWVPVREVEVAGAPHVLVRWPCTRVQRLVAATKAPLGPLLQPLLAQDTGGAAALGGDGYLGDDAAPVPGSDLVAACDAVLPAMVEREPWWAGWCAALVNVGDVAAMGAEPVGLLDALAARDTASAAQVLAGLRAGAEAFGVPVLGGYTQLGVPAALSVTALGRVPGGAAPVPAGGGRAGMAVSLAVDTTGGWRAGHPGRQWDSSTGRDPAALRALTRTVAVARPAAAKDVSMAGLVGTLAMLAEASGCGAVLDVSKVPRPAGAGVGDWLTCFPGSGWVTADAPGAPLADPGVPGFAVAACGELTPGAGAALRWPDGEVTPAVGPATGLGPATGGGTDQPGTDQPTRSTRPDQP